MSRYNIDGKNLPSCTTIIDDCVNKSGALTQWAANMVVEWIRQNTEPSKKIEEIEPWLQGLPTEGTHGYYITEDQLNEARFAFRKVSEEALDVGTEVHNAIEDYLAHDFIGGELRGQAKIAFESFLKFMVAHDMTPVTLEETVFDDYWAGTLDFYGYYDDKLYVIDFKTSKAFYMDSMGPQIAAYFSRKPEAEGSGILRLDKETGLPEFKDTTKIQDKQMRRFNCMVALYYANHPRISKEVDYKEEQLCGKTKH